MKVGDLVKMQAMATGGWGYPSCCGLVVKVEKEFYMHQGERPSDFQDRITIVWQNGDESFEPSAILEVVNEGR